MDLQIIINTAADDSPEDRSRLRRALAIILDCEESAVVDRSLGDDDFGEADANATRSEAVETSTPPAAKRVPGQPAPGRKRRTKEEVAEDDAYFAAQERQKAHAVEPASTAAPSTIDPRDAADEARESAGVKTTGDLTLEDLRNAVGRYAAAKGFPAAQADIPVLLGRPMIETPKDEIAAAIAKIDAALAGSDAGGALFNQPEKAETALFEAAPEPKDEPVQATKADVIEAFKAYARKYDGRDDVGPQTTPIVLADGPRILQQTLGKDTINIASIPNNPLEYGKALTAINKALVENPFGRAPK